MLVAGRKLGIQRRSRFRVTSHALACSKFQCADRINQLTKQLTMKPFLIFLNNRNIVASSGLLLLVILSLFLSRGCGSSSEPVPPPSTPPGTFSLTGPVDDLVSKSIAEGKVFLEDIETKKVLRLEWKPDANEMELPPGKYRLRTIWEQNEQESHSKSTDGAQFKFGDWSRCDVRSRHRHGA